MHVAAQDQERERAGVRAAVATCALYPKLTERNVRKLFWRKLFWNAKVAGIARRKQLFKVAMTRTKNAGADSLASRRGLAPHLRRR